MNQDIRYRDLQRRVIVVAIVLLVHALDQTHLRLEAIPLNMGMGHQKQLLGKNKERKSSKKIM